MTEDERLSKRERDFRRRNPEGRQPSRETIGERSRTHGHSPEGRASPTYLTWAAMVQRCANPNNPSYPRYGGRGITVCDRWLSFAEFLADMGERPPGLTLERRNNDGSYEKDNCAWASMKEQRRNQGRNRAVLRSDGQVFRTILEAAEQVGGNRRTLRSAMLCGRSYMGFIWRRLDDRA